MNFDEIVAAFKGNLLEKLVKKHGPERFESRWTELVKNEYDQKVPLVTQLIGAGADLDWKDDKGYTPMELALAAAAGNRRKVVTAMLRAEAARFDVQQMVYRLVRRGCVELLRMFFEMERISEEVKFRMVSLALEEAHVRRVGLKKEMENFCNKVVLRNFYRINNINKMSLPQRRQHINQRIDIVCSEIEFLQSYGIECFTNIDNNFLTSLEIVSENLQVVDLLWKHASFAKLQQFTTWISLQPDKINYLIQIFMDVLNERFPDLGLAIDKNLLLDMLSMLKLELQSTKDYMAAKRKESFLVSIASQNNVNEKWRATYPHVKLTKKHQRWAKKRDFKALTTAGFTIDQQKYLGRLVFNKKSLQQLCEQWSQEYPEVRLGRRAIVWASGKGNRSAGPFSNFSRRTRYVLKMVNRVYSRVKSYYSLTSMIAHIVSTYNLPLTDQMVIEFGYAACQRTVQIVGEFCKNTKLTPNLHSELHQQLSLWSSPSLLEVFQHRRNAATHGLSLTEVNFRVLQHSGELSADVLLRYCQLVLSELRESLPHLKYYQMCELTRMIKGCLGRIRQLKSLEQRASFGVVMDKMKRSSWQDAPSAGLYNFEEIFTVLNFILNQRVDRHLHDTFESIKIIVKEAYEKHNEYISTVKEVQLTTFKLIESCGRYCEYNVLERVLKLHLNLAHEYYTHVPVQLLLRKANELMQANLVEKQYSSDTGDSIRVLARLLANKVDRESQLSKAHQISQFVPHQNERYTERLLESLGVSDLCFEQFYAVHDALDNLVFDPLSKQHEVGMFAVEQKFNVIKRVLNQHNIKYNAQLLDKSQKEDTARMQQLLEQMLESLYKLSCAVKVDPEHPYNAVRLMAVQYGLLEICASLSHTEPFRSNFDYFNTPMPLLAGRYLRNMLAHDFIVSKSASIFGPETYYATVEVLYELRTTLLGSVSRVIEPQPQRCALPYFGEITEKYRRRKRLAEEQNISTKGKLDMILNGRLDIYGHYYFVWKGIRNRWHNFLDVVLYCYPVDAIAYIEECSHPSGSSQAASVFSHLWNRLRVSELLGWPLQSIVKLYSLGGMNTGILHNGGLAEEVDRIMQQMGRSLGVSTEDFGYDPPEQIEKILCYFLRQKRLDKFVEFFHRYGEKFDFVKFHELYSDIPDVVDKLAQYLPWGVDNEQGYSVLHWLCASNNVVALKSALKWCLKIQLCIRSKDQSTPIQVAVWNSSFEAVRLLLESRKLSQLDAYTLTWVIETFQNDLLKYFIPSLESDRMQENFVSCGIKIGTTVNIDACRMFSEKLSKKAFLRIFPDDGSLPLVLLAIGGGNKKHSIKQLLAFPKLRSRCNLQLAFLGDLSPGRFKYTDFLLSNGATIDFSAIKRIVHPNCFKRLKWLLRRSEIVLTDSQQKEICMHIISNGRDIRMLKCFPVKIKTLPDSDQARMLELTLARRAFNNCRFLCETFPTLVENYNKPYRLHPLALAIQEIQQSNCLTRERPFLLFLIAKSTNIPTQTILLDALKLCDLQIIQTLIEAGAQIDVEDDDFTPLSLAAHNCETQPSTQNYAIFELLLKASSHGSLQNLIFTRMRYLRFIRLLELLIEHTSFRPDSKELLVILLHVQTIIAAGGGAGGGRLLPALLRKYRFLAASLAFDSGERLVLDRQFKLVLPFEVLIERLLRFWKHCKVGTSGQINYKKMFSSIT